MTDPSSPFNWNTGEPSVMWTRNGEALARKQAQLGAAGKSMDCAGRAAVDLKPQGQNFTLNSHKNAVRKGGASS